MKSLDPNVPGENPMLLDPFKHTVYSDHSLLVVDTYPSQAEQPTVHPVPGCGPGHLRARRHRCTPAMPRQARRNSSVL